MSYDAIARISIALLVSTTLIIGSVGAIGTVAAQGECDMSSPEGMNNCDDDDFDSLSDTIYEEVLGNIYSVAHTTLQYLGFVTVFAGVTLWWGTSESSDRAQIGMWLTFSGLAMIVMFFGFSTLVGLLEWIASGGG